MLKGNNPKGKQGISEMKKEQNNRSGEFWPTRVGQNSCNPNTLEAEAERFWV
jgi:hypothetical protein